MAPDRRPDRISDLYHAALKRPPAERAAFLAASCGDDAALQQEVESLLAYHAGSRHSSRCRPPSPSGAPPSARR